MRARVDVGVDAQRDARAVRPAADAAAEMPRDLVLALGVELADARARGPAAISSSRLADAGEHDALGREPGAQRGPQLAAGDDVRARAQAGEEAQQGAGAVGLQRVADAMRHGGERAVVGAVGLAIAARL